MFHVSQLNKCLRVTDQRVDVEGVQITPDATISEYPIRILDQKDRVTRNSTTRLYKVQWSHHSEEEATWETEEYLEEKFPDFFTSI